ncbi:hypothetical protein [Agromyces lapidis]|uniref:Flagellar export protein FliJ n=1 Tax=Agromyces lapidis TaxID=279574 RepID=A0ABV5SMD6_9MICO|nr:hypothetical protein [Agromyces lapidis]
MGVDTTMGILDQREHEIETLDALIAQGHVRVEQARELAASMRESAELADRRARGEENNLRRECNGVNALVAAREALMAADAAYRGWASSESRDAESS